MTAIWDEMNGRPEEESEHAGGGHGADDVFTDAPQETLSGAEGFVEDDEDDEERFDEPGDDETDDADEFDDADELDDDDELDDNDELDDDDDELDDDEIDEDDETDEEAEEEFDDEAAQDELDDEVSESGREDEAADGELGEDELDEEELDFSTVATGGSVEEAKRTALEQLRKIVPYAREDDVEYLVVEEGGRSGFLGMGGRVAAQVEARLRPTAGAPLQAVEESPVGQDVASFLRTVVDLMGLEATVAVTDDGEEVVAELAGPDLGILIGRHGQTIDALQYVTMIAANRAHKMRRRVVVDAEGYRERRAASLHAIADRTAQKVARDREAIALKPMTAAERKVIHLRLKDDPRVQTSSEGQEPNRSVVVAPKPRA